MKLLIIEDESLLQERLQLQFTSKAALVDTAETASEGLYYLQEFAYDVVILDIGLPDLNGLEVLQQLRSGAGPNNHTPVLILSARSSWQEKVEGLKLGADDYLAKPFEFEELWARVEVLGRRAAKVEMLDVLEFPPYRLDLGAKTLLVGDQEVVPTLTEFRLLQAFFKNPHRVLSKEQLLQRISDHSQERESNVIEVYVRKLRKMLGKEAIQTLRGLGYKFIPDTGGES